MAFLTFAKVAFMRRNGLGHHSDSQLSTYILQYAKCDSLAEASAILDEAYAGNPAAQYITAVALAPFDAKASETWMEESAAQGFKPALIKIRRLNTKSKQSDQSKRAV